MSFRFGTVPVTPAVEKSLHRIAKAGDLERLKQMLEDNPTLIDTCDRDGCSALHHACRWNRKECVDYLISLHASVEIQDADHWTPLHKAARWGYHDIIESLLKHSHPAANIVARDSDGRTPLHWASLWGRVEAVRVLLENGAPVDAHDSWRDTACHRACDKSHEKVVELLLVAGANPNSLDEYNSTPLHRAASKGATAAALLLIRYGSDMFARDKSGKTPLYVAVEKDQLEVVRLILDLARTDLLQLVNEPSKLSRRPLDVCRSDGIRNLLIAAGAIEGPASPELSRSQSPEVRVASPSKSPLNFSPNHSLPTSQESIVASIGRGNTDRLQNSDVMTAQELLSAPKQSHLSPIGAPSGAITPPPRQSVSRVAQESPLASFAASQQKETLASSNGNGAPSLTIVSPSPVKMQDLRSAESPFASRGRDEIAVESTQESLKPTESMQVDSSSSWLPVFVVVLAAVVSGTAFFYKSRINEIAGKK